MFLKVLENLYGLAFLLLPIVCCFMIFISVYSIMLYRELQKVEPEFFSAKNGLYYMDKVKSTQFAFNILFSYCSEIKNEAIRKKCIFLKKLSYIVIPCFIFIFIVLMFGLAR